VGLIAGGEDRDKVEKELEKRAHILGDTMFWEQLILKTLGRRSFSGYGFCCLIFKEKGTLREKKLICGYAEQKRWRFLYHFRASLLSSGELSVLKEESSVLLSGCFATEG
jgi:hypothetical protein